VLVREAFVRRFANGKALGSYAGLTSSPYSSGGIDREQGIGKGGNRRLRTVMVELAWLWTRYQPAAAQVCWFRERGRINWAARSQNHSGGLSAETANRAVEIRHRRRSA
jgi:transposase